MDCLRSRLDNLDALLRSDSAFGSFKESSDNCARSSSSPSPSAAQNTHHPHPHVLLQDITENINTANAFQVLQRCDELEAMLNSIDTKDFHNINSTSNSSLPSRKVHIEEENENDENDSHRIGRRVNDAYENFIFARKAQDDAARARSCGVYGECNDGWGLPATDKATRNTYGTRSRRVEAHAYDTMFPTPPSMRMKPKRKLGRRSASRHFSFPGNGSVSSCRRDARNVKHDRWQHQQHFYQQHQQSIADEVRSASHAAVSAVRAAAEAVRQGPGATKSAALASRKEKVALAREISALRKNASATSRQVHLLQQRASVREEELVQLKKVLKLRDDFILEAEARLKDLHKLHAEEIEIERSKANDAIATRDNLALVYRTSLMRLLNDRCDQCRKKMNPDDFGKL